MKLKELLKTIPDEEWLYIGAASGFVCIQKRAGTEKTLKEKSEYYLKMYQEQKRITETRINNHPSHMEKLNAALQAALQETVQAAEVRNQAKKIRKCEEDIAKAENIYRNALKNLKRLENILDEYKGFLDREVKDTYRRKDEKPLGTIIVVEGYENGPYWMLSEVERDG